MGPNNGARAELLRNEQFRPAAGVKTYEATQVRGESTRAAYAEAEEWLLTQRDDNDPPVVDRGPDSE